MIICNFTQLRKIVRSVRASPQRRQHWYQEVDRMNVQLLPTEQKSALMLILDVKTRWSSTHQMLRTSFFKLNKNV